MYRLLRVIFYHFPTNKTAPKATTTTAPEAIQIFVLIDIHPLLFDSIIFITPIVHICFLLYHYYYFTKPLSMMLKMHKKGPFWLFTEKKP